MIVPPYCVAYEKKIGRKNKDAGEIHVLFVRRSTSLFTYLQIATLRKRLLFLRRFSERIDLRNPRLAASKFFMVNILRSYLSRNDIEFWTIKVQRNCLLDLLVARKYWQYKTLRN